MKKLFLFLPALLLSLVTNAATINVSPGTKALRCAYNSAEAGSTLVLGAGIYDETERIEFTKSMTIKAADGADVIVKTSKDNPLTLGAEVKFVDIKFDGSAMGTREYFIRSYDATAGNELHFENCEIYDFPSTTYLINAASDSRSLDSIIINNCYFHGNGNDAIYVNGATASKGVIVKNSTFANSSASHSIIEVRNAGEVAEDIELVVDHCTFYNNTFGDGDYSNIRSYKLSKSYITNCIFANSEPYAKYAAYSYGGTINSCLTYNLTSGYRDWSPCATLTNNITADPLFTNAAESDFTLDEASPAVDAGTDGKTLGDPRWWPVIVLPETDFATPYVCDPDDAKTSGRIALTDGNLVWNNNADATLNGVATWKINVTRACFVSVTVTELTANGHCYSVTLLDADGDPVGEPVAEAADTWKSGDLALGTLIIPAPGEYTFKLANSTGWSTAAVSGLTLSYIGGAVQNMPGITAIADAWFSAEGTRADGKIDFPDGTIQDGWVKWNVAFTSAANYNVIVNIDNANGHNYTVALYEDEDDASPIILSEGSQKSTIGTLEMGTMEVPAGNYILKVTNAVQWSDAQLISVQFAYAGGGIIEFGKDDAASLLANADAILSDDWTIEDSKITHAESKALTGWAKWNVDCADYGIYNVTVNISSDNGHLVRVEIFEDEAAAPIYTLDETSATQYHTGDQAIDLGNIVLDAREYVVKVSNTGAYSHVQIASIAITYLNGAQATLPVTCTFADLMLSEKAHITAGELWFNTIGDSNPVGQWAKWNVKVAEAGTFLFTMNVNSSNGQSYKISILDGETEIDAFESGSVGSGDKEVKHYFNLAAGNYTVKLENTYAWSQGHIVSLVVTQPSLLTIDEAATSNTAIHNNYRNGSHDIQIIRTITAGMYNTICLPFDVTSAQLRGIFGADVELRQMASATLSDDVLTLNFDAATSIYRGTPYLIKTTKAIVNPVFTDVEIKEETGQATSGDNANFVGSFIKGTVPAGEDNLFLGANDLLYFSEAATTIKGMRAYFQIHDVPSGAPIRQARIVEQGNVVTALEFVNGEWQEVKSANGTIKTIENGQLILIRDGKRYNVMGVRF